MARPPNADPEATKARILDAAAHLFATNGLAGTGLREVASEAGVSLSLVSHYFGGKEDLYRTVVAAMIEKLTGLSHAFAVELSAPAADAREVIARATRLGYRFARQHREAVLLLQRSILETGAVDTELRKRSVLPFLERSSEVLAMLTGRPASALRLPIQSAVFLVVRYAIATKRDLAGIAGVPTRGAEVDVYDEIEAHLVETIEGMLLRARVSA